MVKEELLCGDLAIASLNFHRNFFGERCGIQLASGGPAFTGCVGMGLERWIHVLQQRHGASALAVVKQEADRLTQAPAPA